jgi:hypothetical protein
MPDIKKIIIEILTEWSNENYWYGYNQFQDEILIRHNIKIDMKDLKLYFKELKYEGKIRIFPIYNDEGILSGSGYFVKSL